MGYKYGENEYMRTQIHTISKENYPQIIEWLESSFNMLGGCAYVTAIAILLRVTIGLPFDFEFLITFFFAALMMSFTFPSVPGATVIVMTSIFGMAGVPTAAVTLFFGIDPLVDGIRTVSNMVGNLSSSFLLARLEGKLDKHIYYE